MSDARPLHRDLGMTDSEFSSVVGLLGRDPRLAELAMYSVMWSEHCSYKSSRPHLSRFPTEAPWVVVGPGENAGVVDLGDGWLAALRIESHNHPSFVEPYQGAATGVGGILRDVFTMGARPIALWDQIRFGHIDEPRNRYLFSGVVAGIAGYGNAVGVPTVGGEVAFEDCYDGNPLVNVMCLGILRREQLVLGTAGEAGTIAVLLGASTGRDGIGGASVLASASFAEDSSGKRPSVQVGDPFQEKKLIEACLELYKDNLVVGIQDLGAAGLSCSTSEPAARAGMGMEVDLNRVHVREHDMTPAELLMSESQERMMAFVHPDQLDDVMAVAGKWEIDASIVGEVKSGGMLRVFKDGDLVAEVPAASLSEDAPTYDRPFGEPGWQADLWSDTIEFVQSPDIRESLLTILDDPSIGDPSWVYEQYDHMLFLNTVVGPGDNGTLLRIKGTSKGLAVSTDGNGRLCYLDPRRGAARLVYESALNVAMVGARPLAVVDNLNFGNPEKPDVMWQFVETVEGISQACEALGIPVIGGNVSFYNETNGVDIFPTPVVGMLGLADPMPAEPPRLEAGREGMEVWLMGSNAAVNLAGSAFERIMRRHVGGRPGEPDSLEANAIINLARHLATEGTAPVLHDLSDGGLAVAIAEICIRSGLGARIQYADWRALFSEDPHRFLAVADPEAAGSIRAAAADSGVVAQRIGSLGGKTIEFFGDGDVETSIGLGEATEAWRNAIRGRMEPQTATSTGS
ncbi:MAG: phosphoribosylformylglycinamidine synthase subunit PurL [Acidimicrobiia bacterium]|nr:phosphoribosylformylglycinamidine synthase subunit PurL [Acidimicrobiia bacterium]